MDLTMIGLNLTVIAGIVCLTEVVKLFLPVAWDRFVILIPLALGVVASIGLTRPFELQGIIITAIEYAGVSSYIFKFGKKIVLGKK